MAFSLAPAGTSSLLAVLRKLNSFSCYCSSFCALTPKHTPLSRGEVLKKEFYCRAFMCWSELGDVLSLLEHLHPSLPCELFQMEVQSSL